jgi:hydroxymethylbilane synthase
LRKVADGEFDATILAAAGLKRLGLLTDAMHEISLDELTPAPGQAALAVECRAGATELIELLSQIDDATARLCVTAERAVLRTLSASCATAAGAYAFIDDRGLLNLTADVSSVETTEQIRVQVAMPVADEMAAVALGEMVANELIEDGAYELIGETRG